MLLAKDSTQPLPFYFSLNIEAANEKQVQSYLTGYLTFYVTQSPSVAVICSSLTRSFQPPANIFSWAKLFFH